MHCCMVYNAESTGELMKRCFCHFILLFVIFISVLQATCSGSSLVIKIACAKRRSIEFMRSVHSFLTEHSTCISLNP